MGEGFSDLMDFVSAMGGERQLRVEENLGQGFVVLRVSEAERRQAKHDIRCVEDAVIELLRNARDAGAAHIFLASSRDGDRRTLVALDDGCGIPASLQERVFDARVTSKLESAHMDRWGLHGRGMALFSVRENAESASVVASEPERGTSIRVVFDTEQLTERADQSTWPELSRDAAGQAVVERGPHNILRTCAEFAVEERGNCELFVGSAAEIAATLRSLGLANAELSVTILGGLAEATSARELRDAAASLGLEMSERTAHRIMSGQLAPLPSVASLLMPEGSTVDTLHEPDLLRDRRGLRITHEDTRAFSRLMERDFTYLAERYYLKLVTDPKLRYRKGKLTVTFELESED